MTYSSDQEQTVSARPGEAALPDYQPGTKVFGDWVVAGQLGAGAFGAVYRLQKHSFGFTTESAMKVIRIPQSQSDVRSVLSEGMDVGSATDYFRGVVDEIVQEIAVMAQLKSHPAIVAYEDHQILPHEGSIGWDILIRMELLTPLIDYQQAHPMGRDEILSLGIQLSAALAFCESRHLIHRDIKPENIFVNETGFFKLGDFGVARTVERTSGGLSKKGTESYMAPEVYLGHPYGPSVDLYSLGLVLYRLFNHNRLPFFPAYPAPITFRSREEALSQRMRGEALPPPDQADPALAAVILKACAYRPEDRYSTADALKSALQELAKEPAAPRQAPAKPVSPAQEKEPIRPSSEAREKKPAQPSSEAREKNAPQPSPESQEKDAPQPSPARKKKRAAPTGLETQGTPPAASPPAQKPSDPPPKPPLWETDDFDKTEYVLPGRRPKAPDEGKAPSEEKEEPAPAGKASSASRKSASSGEKSKSAEKKAASGAGKKKAASSKPPQAEAPSGAGQQKAAVNSVPPGPTGFFGSAEYRAGIQHLHYRRNPGVQEAALVRGKKGVGKGEVWVTQKFAEAAGKFPLTVTMTSGIVWTAGNVSATAWLSKLLITGEMIVVRCVYPDFPDYSEEITFHLVANKALGTAFAQLDGVTDMVYVYGAKGKSLRSPNTARYFPATIGVTAAFSNSNPFYGIRSALCTGYSR